MIPVLYILDKVDKKIIFLRYIFELDPKSNFLYALLD